MQIGKARHRGIYVVLGKTKNEGSRGLKRLYKGRNSVPKFQDILHWRNHLNRQRKQAFQHRKHNEAPLHPRCCKKRPDPYRRRLGHRPVRHMRLAHGLGGCAWFLAKKVTFVTFSTPRACIISPSQVETFPVNTTFLIHNFSFITGEVQEEGDSRSHMRSYIVFLSF